MRKRRKAIGWGLTAALIVLTVVAIVWLTPLFPLISRPELSGVVLLQDKDPEKQIPVSGVDVTASIAGQVFKARSDAFGFFKFKLGPELPNRKVSLIFRQSGYQELEVANAKPEQLLIARLTAIHKRRSPAQEGGVVRISNVKLRYTSKATTTNTIGSIVRPLIARNTGNVACGAELPCSPDGKWKATLTSVSYDAGENNQFINVRASCVAGPCAFARLESNNIANPGRKLQVSVLNWSDPVTFLVEAEVSRTMMSDMVRQSFPALFGNAMDFTLPATAEGPSIEAELNGTFIVFPLGPNLLLSWATCNAETAKDATQLFRCELKPAFAFQ